MIQNLLLMHLELAVTAIAGAPPKLPREICAIPPDARFFLNLRTE